MVGGVLIGDVAVGVHDPEGSWKDSAVDLPSGLCELYGPLVGFLKGITPGFLMLGKKQNNIRNKRV